MHEVRLFTTLQRKDPRLPVFVVVPGQLVHSWHLGGTAVVEGSVNGHPMGRRTLKAWGKGSEDWFFELTTSFCAATRLSTGESISVSLVPADMSLPFELMAVFARDLRNEQVWRTLSTRLQRELSEHVRAAKTVKGRLRRAEDIAARLSNGTIGFKASKPARQLLKQGE